MKRQGDKETRGQGEASVPLSPYLLVPLSNSYFFPFDGAAAAPAAAPGLASVLPLAGAAAPLAGAAAAAPLAPAVPAAGAAPVAAAPATAPAAPSATSSLAPLPPTTSLRLATFGSPNTLFCSFHFSASFRRVRRSSRVSTLRCRTRALAPFRLRSNDIIHLGSIAYRLCDAAGAARDAL